MSTTAPAITLDQLPQHVGQQVTVVAVVREVWASRTRQGRPYAVATISTDTHQHLTDVLLTPDVFDTCPRLAEDDVVHVTAQVSRRSPTDFFLHATTVTVL